MMIHTCAGIWELLSTSSCLLLLCWSLAPLTTDFASPSKEALQSSQSWHRSGSLVSEWLNKKAYAHYSATESIYLCDNRKIYLEIKPRFRPKYLELSVPEMTFQGSKRCLQPVVVCFFIAVKRPTKTGQRCTSWKSGSCFYTLLLCTAIQQRCTLNKKQMGLRLHIFKNGGWNKSSSKGSLSLRKFLWCKRKTTTK